MSKFPVITYLMFGGRCDEALQFYKTALGAEIRAVMRFNESPTPPPPGVLQSGFENKVMHSEFTLNGTTFMASDGCDDKTSPGGFSIVLSERNEADAHGAFNALAAGGKVNMPLGKTFWSPCYGMLTDKFGISWMVMVPGERQG